MAENLQHNKILFDAHDSEADAPNDFLDEYLNRLRASVFGEKRSLDATDGNSTPARPRANEDFKFSGSLFLIGGAADTTWTDMVSRLPANAKVVAVGLAAEEEGAAGADLASGFEASGIKPENITVISNEAKPANTKYNWTNTLPDKFDLVYFGGGDQSLLKERFKETAKLEDALKTGVMVAGNSAGTAIMPTEMITGGDAANLTHAPGFSLLPWAVTDTHVHQRHREDRDVSALYDIGKGKLPVLGIDPDTRIILRWEGEHVVGEVAGYASVRIFKMPGQDLKVESAREVKPQLTYGSAGAGQDKTALVWELKEGDKFILH